MTAREVGRTWAERRFAGCPKGKRGRLFQRAGDAAMVAGMFGVADVRGVEHAARERWRELKVKEAATLDDEIEGK